MTIDNVSGGELIDPAWGNAVADAINPTTWTAVTYTNSWVDGSPYQGVEYRKINDMVYVRGRCKSGTTGTSAFTLPVGYRPPASLSIPSVNADGTPDIALINVGTDGTCVIYCAATIVSIACEFAFSLTA